MIHYLDQISDLLVLSSLNKPLSKVPLDSHVKHLFLLACQTCRSDFVLYFNEFLRTQLQHLSELLRAEEKRSFSKLPRQRHFHKLESRYDGQGLAGYSH